MATGKALNGKPYAGNPHVRFDEGEVAPAATPRRGSLLYKTKKSFYNNATVFCAVASAFICGVALADAPATASWVGGGDRDVITDPDNWQCFDAGGNVIADAIPDASATTVSITGTTTFNCPEGQSVIWKTLTISGTVNLGADCDWRGVGQIFGGFVAAGTTLNMKGHKLYVKASSDPNRRINVTDDSAAGSGGEFHIDVPEGVQFKNSAGWGSNNVFWFSGSVEVVKDGKGSYMPSYHNSGTGARYYQQTGGTRIHEGLVYLGNDAEGTKNETYYAQSNRPVFGAYGAPITIDAGGTLDYKGIYDIHRYGNMYMNGGTFTNTRAPAHPEWGANGTLVFRADSFIDVARTAHIAGPFTLNGHTLTATIAANQIWYCRAGSANNGTIKLEGAGVFKSYTEAITATNNVTYDIACAIDVTTSMSVSDYVARYTGAANTGTADFKVFGTFTPVADGFYPVTMQNGSVIDLSAKTGTWSSTGATGAIKFASGSVVTLDVGARSLAHGERVLAWSEVPENVAFRITGTSIADTESARMEADGVYYDVPDADVVATAHWVGAGARNDFDDPANWVCTNMVGALAVGAVPGDRSGVFFGVFNFDLTNAATIAKLSTYQSVALEPPMALTTDCDWSGLSVNDNLFAGKTINLAGHAFKLTAPEGVSQRTFTVTDAMELGGRFVLDVPQGVTFENTLITIGGTVAFVKDGAGLFIPHRYGQPYTGGNTVAAGTLRLYNDAVANSATFSPIKAGYGQPLGVHRTSVYVEAGAFYDINGVYDINCYPVVLRGGTITNSKAQTQYNWGSIGNVTLEADSFIDVAYPTVVFSGGTSVFTLNGYTLTAQFPASDEWRPPLYMRGVVVSNGTVTTTGSGYLDFHDDATAAETATFDVESCMTLNANVIVSNYVARHASIGGSGASAIHVLSSFKPFYDRFYNTVLHEGATIDLSALSDTMKSSTPIGALSYDVAASNITINVGARTLQANEHLIAWSAVPEGVTFTLVGDNVDGSKICVIENGVFYDVAADSTLVTSATWTGLAGNGDISNPDNWSCVNAHGNSVPNGVPGISANVQISGTYGASVATAAAMPWQSVTFGSISLMDDMDMRGFGNFFSLVTAGSTIDLRGHKLYVNTPSGNPPVALTVTDSTSDTSNPGELHITVPAGATFTNNRVTLSGNLKLVKEGTGVFMPQVYNLAYTGGNVIADGTLKLYNTNKDNSEYAFDQKNYPRPLGAYGVPVVVESGATFDINGVYGTNNQQFRLSGGTFISSYNQTHTTWGGLGNVTLSDDSFMNVGNSIVATSPYNLGGHTFTVSLASGKAFYLRSVVQDGTLCITGAGTLQTLNTAGSQTMDFDVAAALNVGATLNVRNYVARYEGSSNAGTAALNVYGTFTPVTDNFYGCTMQNGSTLDLTAKTEVWSTTGAFTNGANTVTFAANSVVNVALAADRELTFDEHGLAQVVAWETEPPDTTKFKLAGPALERKRPLLRRSGGLYMMRSMMMIIVR